MVGDVWYFIDCVVVGGVDWFYDFFFCFDFWVCICDVVDCYFVDGNVGWCFLVVCWYGWDGMCCYNFVVFLLDVWSVVVGGGERKGNVEFWVEGGGWCVCWDFWIGVRGWCLVELIKFDRVDWWGWDVGYGGSFFFIE